MPDRKPTLEYHRPTAKPGPATPFKRGIGFAGFIIYGGLSLFLFGLAAIGAWVVSLAWRQVQTNPEVSQTIIYVSFAVLVVSLFGTFCAVRAIIAFKQFRK